MAAESQPPKRRPVLVRSWELEAYSPRSDAFPVENRWNMVATHRRKGAPELLALAPQR
jgi:hypothetical protein